MGMLAAFIPGVVLTRPMGADDEEHWDHASLQPSGAMVRHTTNKKDLPHRVSSKVGGAMAKDRLESMKLPTQTGHSATALLHLTSESASGRKAEFSASPQRLAAASVPRGDPKNDMGDFSYVIIGFIISAILASCGGFIFWKIYLLPKMQRDAKKVAKDPPPPPEPQSKKNKKDKKDKGGPAATSLATPEPGLATTAAAADGAPLVPAPLPIAPKTATDAEAPKAAEEEGRKEG